MARKKYFSARISRKMKNLIAVVAVIAAVAWLMSLTSVSSQIGQKAGVDGSSVSYYADVIFTFAISLLLFLLAVALAAVPAFNILLIVAAIAVLYHALRKINII